MVAVFVAIAGVACRSGTLSTAPVVSVSASGQAIAPALAIFSPGSTSPARKAKLEAVRSRLDQLFQARMEQAHATALVAGIVLDGELAYARSLGVRDLVSRDAVDGDSVFRIASVTKNFTALAIMRLRDQGRVSLDADAAVYLPELRSLAGRTRDAPPITVRMLLTHASGLAFDDYWGGDTFGMSPEELTRFLEAGVSLSRAPGMRYAYSNLGYALLGRIVERVSGVGFRAYVTANILRPLGMTATVWEADDVPRGRLALGYLWKGGKQGREPDRLIAEPLPPDGTFAAAGGLYTSPRDYARYVAFNLAAYPPRDDPESGPCRRSTVREMHEGQRRMRSDDPEAGPVAARTPDGVSLRAGSYGFGWHNLTTCDEPDRIQHGGYEPGYFSNVVLLPEQGVGIFVMATTGSVASASALPILRDAGLLPRAADVAPIPELIEASRTITQLLARWDAARVEQTFDRASLRFSWFANFREEFARLAADHGRCHQDGSMTTYGPMRGTWVLACDRGTIELDAVMSPAVPSRVQVVLWREEFPADESGRRIAFAVAAAIDHGWSDARTGGLFFAAPGDLATMARWRKTVARLAIDYSGCVVEGGVRRTDHQVLGQDSSNAIFRLRCAEGPLELQFSTDPATGKVVDLAGYPPRDRDATCWR
jgi:D-alanyl-D-alanine-carboxypeptidase/D-alanyl-D-alanine-endopeptidase